LHFVKRNKNIFLIDSDESFCLSCNVKKYYQGVKSMKKHSYISSDKRSGGVSVGSPIIDGVSVNRGGATSAYPISNF
jgi:hypothetical protein